MLGNYSLENLKKLQMVNRLHPNIPYACLIWEEQEVNIPPPIMTTEFNNAMTQMFWNHDKRELSTNIYYFWNRRYQPIADEL